MNEDVADLVSELRATLMQIKCSSLQESTFFEHATDVLQVQGAIDVSKFDYRIFLRATGVTSSVQAKPTCRSHECVQREQ